MLKKTATANDKLITIITILKVSRRLGQLTRRSSSKDSFRNFLVATIYYLKVCFLILNVKVFNRRSMDLNESLARFDFLSHQNIKHPVGFFGILNCYEF